METKLCKACGIEKTTNLFFNNPHTKDGLFARCKLCVKDKAYIVWGSMLTRCYKDNANLTYNDVTVCLEWHNFQNFAQWYEQNCEYHMQEWELDKDIICKDCKEYSPENCTFVPHEINCLFRQSPKRELPTGIYETKYGYKAINFQRTNKNRKSKTMKNLRYNREPVTVEEAINKLNE